MTTTTLLAETVRALRACGLNAVVWDTGGGMEGIAIAAGDKPPDEPRFFFGTAGSTWAGEVLDDPTDSLITAVVATETDAAAIAAGILRSLAEHLTHKQSRH